MSGFDLSKTVDTSRSVVINYLPLGITSIFRDDVNQYITADCAISSSSNITYTDGGNTTEYKANKLWIISNSNNTKMNEINGVQANAQLIIRNVNANGDKILSENYLQHADHFTRILNERESFKRERNLDEKLDENGKETNKLSKNVDVSEKNLKDNSNLDPNTEAAAEAN